MTSTSTALLKTSTSTSKNGTRGNADDGLPSVGQIIGLLRFPLTLRHAIARGGRIAERNHFTARRNDGSSPGTAFRPVATAYWGTPACSARRGSVAFPGRTRRATRYPPFRGRRRDDWQCKVACQAGWFQFPASARNPDRTPPPPFAVCPVGRGR